MDIEFLGRDNPHVDICVYFFSLRVFIFFSLRQLYGKCTRTQCLSPAPLAYPRVTIPLKELETTIPCLTDPTKLLL